MGGVCGGIVLMAAVCHYLKFTYLRYLKAKDIPKDMITLRRVEFDIEKLKVNIADLNKEFYNQYDKENR